MKRINWHERYLELAKFVARWSKDPSTKTGAVLTRFDRTVISVGYNGFPKGMPDDPELYQNREEKYSRIVHCEINALLHAREPLQGATLYTWPFASCDRCAVVMASAGVIQFVYPSLPEELKLRWQDSLTRTVKYLDEMNLTHVEVNNDGIS